MAITLIQTKTNHAANVASLTATFDNPTTTGNAIVVSSCCVGNLEILVNISDTYGNTWTEAHETTTNHTNLEVWSAGQIIAGNNHAVTITSRSGTRDMNIIIREYSGLDTPPLHDKHSTTSSSGTPSTTLTSGTSNTLTQPNQLVIAAASTDIGSTQSYSVQSGYGNLVTVLANASSDLAMADKVVSSTNPVSTSFTVGATTSFWNCGVYTFKSAQDNPNTSTSTSSTSISTSSTSTSLSTSTSSTVTTTSTSSTSSSTSNSTNTTTSTSTSASTSSTSSSISTSSSTSFSTSTSSTTTLPHDVLRATGFIEQNILTTNAQDDLLIALVDDPVILVDDPSASVGSATTIEKDIRLRITLDKGIGR